MRIVTAALAVWLLPKPALAADEDPWWGRDKALHFGVSATIAGVGYATSSLWLDRRWQRATAGGSLALAAGLAKEGWDMTGAGNPSYRDLTWDLAGALAGVGVAWAIDVALSPTERSAATVQANLRGAELRWRF